MIYRETGQFKSTYASDQAIFPVVQDRIFVMVVVAAAFLVPPLAANEYWLQAVLIPFLIYALAAIGLNLLTGYAGQVSLGTGGFMAVGAYSAFKLSTSFPGLNIIAVFLVSGFIAALVGVVFGVPSLRIKGFYLAVATLAAQFFLIWLFNKAPWFVNYASSGTIRRPTAPCSGAWSTGPHVAAGARTSWRSVSLPLRSHRQESGAGAVGRSWMAIENRTSRRDHTACAPCDTAPGFRHQLVLLRCWPAPSSCSCTSAAEDARLRHQPVVPRAVHGHRRGPGERAGLIPRRGLHRARADLPDQCSPLDRADDAGRASEADGADGLWHPDRLLPDRRAERTRAALADREREASVVAVPTRVKERKLDESKSVVGRLALASSSALGLRSRGSQGISSAAGYRPAVCPTDPHRQRVVITSRWQQSGRRLTASSSLGVARPVRTKQGVECYERLNAKNPSCQSV